MSSEYYLVEINEKVFVVDSETKRIIGKLDLDNPKPEMAKVLEKVFSKGNKVLIVESRNYTVEDVKEFLSFYARSIGYSLEADWENIKVVKSPSSFKGLPEREESLKKAVSYITETLNLAGYMSLVKPIRYGKVEEIPGAEERKVERVNGETSEGDKKKVPTP